MNNAKICVSVCAERADEFIRNIERAEEYADVIELRFDCLESDDIRRVFDSLPATKKIYLFTFRPKEQGGKREMTFGERLKFWDLTFWSRKSNFMIDIETEPRLVLAVNPDRVERIVSYHHFSDTPADLDATWESMSSLSDGPVKIAVQADDVVDAIPLWKLIEVAKAKNRQIIPIAMGEAGKWTRILGPAHGSAMTYASIDAGSETAPGQITAKDLIETYRVRELDPDTKVFGVIGDPVSQSSSTYMHNPAFAACGVNAVFIPFNVKDIDAFMRRMVRPETREVELNFSGFSVTMPHKQAIMKHMDVIDTTAEKIGAVNTVKIENGSLTAYNTDAHGFIEPLKRHFGDLGGVRVAVCGAGGAARAVVYALKHANAKVSVLARHEKKGRDLADEFDVSFHEFSDFKSRVSNRLAAPFDIVVDTTPVGMKGRHEDETLFAADELLGVRFVYDLVTRAADTPIIREAKKAGVPAIGGLDMLIAQGARQFEIWTGREAPVELMKASAKARMNR